MKLYQIIETSSKAIIGIMKGNSPENAVKRFKQANWIPGYFTAIELRG